MRKAGISGEVCCVFADVWDGCCFGATGCGCSCTGDAVFMGDAGAGAEGDGALGKGADGVGAEGVVMPESFRGELGCLLIGAAL